MKRLLVTGGGGAGAPLLGRFWSPLYEVHFADADPLAFSDEIPDLRRHVIPNGGTPGFEAALLRLCEWLKVDLLIPAVDEELPVMPAVRRAGIDVLCPDDEWYVHNMLDKLGSMRELGKRGVPVPRTVIGKPRWGRGSRDLMVEQEHLDGLEFSVQVMADKNKRLREVVPVRVDLKRGVTIRGAVDWDHDVIGQCVAIHQALPFAGTANIQGMLKDGTFLPFEINPRISTTTGLALAVGADPIAVWFGQPIHTDYSKQPSLSRSWQNTIRYT